LNILKDLVQVGDNLKVQIGNFNPFFFGRNETCTISTRKNGLKKVLQAANKLILFC
jgi:hypothetical protein